jgi:hypothetical protein
MQLLMMCCGICGIKDIKNLPPYFESLWPGMHEHVKFSNRKAPKSMYIWRCLKGAFYSLDFADLFVGT